MAISMNNHVFKGHRTLLGNKYVTYGELELPLREEFFSEAKSFDWGNSSASAKQLAFAMIYQLSDETTAKECADKFMQKVVKKFNFRDWVYSASELSLWIKQNCQKNETVQKSTPKKTTAKKTNKAQKTKENIVKSFCNELGITQKQLAEILEVPEGTVSSWAVKDEIPRLGKKAIEFYIQNQKNQKIVDSYKTFLNLLQEQS